MKKLRFQQASGLDEHWNAALTVYEASLRLLHPFMPFITEELWQRLVHGTDRRYQLPKSISLASYPTEAMAKTSPDAIGRFSVLQEVITAARELRADNKLDPKSTLSATFTSRVYRLAAEEIGVIDALTKLKIKQQAHLAPGTGLIRSTPDFDLQIEAAVQNGTLTPEARARIEKENKSLQRAIANSERQLHDPIFLSRAPEKVRFELDKRLSEYRNKLDKNRTLLEGM